MEENKRKSLMPVIVAMSVVLAVVIIIAVIAVVNAKSGTDEKDAALLEAQQQNEQLQLANEQLQLASEYESINSEFAQYENQTKLLLDEENPLAVKYNASKQKVERLLQELKEERAKGAKNSKEHARRVKELESEIATLKGLLRHYVAQIDSLGKENASLRSENSEIRSRNEDLQSKVKDQAKRNEKLTERITLAEKLNVTGVSLQALKKNGKTEKNVTKASQLMVTFTIPQNNSTPTGMKTIYLRITNPEGDLLGGGAHFKFEGSSLSATAAKQIEYQGEEISGIKIYWDVNTTLTPGEYTVELFADNYRLASRRFTLKK